MNPEPTFERHYPLYIKAPLVLLGLALVVFTLHIAADIIFPLVFAVIFAILLHPIEQWLLRRRVPKLVAITLTVVLGVVALLALLYFIYLQAAQLATQMPLFKAKLLQAATQAQHWLQERFGLSTARIKGYLNQGSSWATTRAGGAFTALSGMVVVLTLLPVYIFLLLLYRPMLITFLTQVFAGRRDEAHSSQVAEVLRESKAAIQSYMVGLLIEASIVATLNTIGLLLLGVKYALLLGVLGALLNFIPYLGGIIAIALPVFVVFVTKDSYGYALGVVGVYMLIQFIDNQFLVPHIVASKVKVNALAAIVGVLVGNAIGGIAGMFLALPIIAILKIIFDRIEPLKPWGLLLGDEESGREKKK
jgi:AI-2 transport protein TqsA